MKICHKCKTEVAEDFFIGRQTQCPFCGTDLHCCLNCSFYDTGSYNDCLEVQAERALEKSRSNFCDFFKFKQTANSSVTADLGTRSKLEGLFKNN
jgi:hypothetical protein